MQLGPHSDRRFDEAAVGVVLQCLVAEVFMDLPDPLGATVRGDAEQGRAAPAQADRGEPSRRDTAVQLGLGRVDAPGYERMTPAVDLELQAVDLALLETVLP